MCGFRSRASRALSAADAEENPHIERQRSTGSTGAGFERFGLRPELLTAVRDAGYTGPRPIQTDALPSALAGRDVLGLAQTGTGKTAAFVLPILQHLLCERRPGPRALVVTPTRELATQVHAELERLARHTRITATTVFGGVPIPRQVRALRRRPDVVVACPGRLLDLLGRGALHLGGVEILVLDEADHMFDMGFLPDVRRILAALPQRRQNLLFSATMPREIRTLADRVLRKPAVLEHAHSQPAETIDHALWSVAEGQKMAVLERLVGGKDFRSAIVFLRTKRRARRLAQDLDRAGHRAVALQGNMSQSQRERALRGFRNGRFDVLVATDIAARGLDVAGVSHVINYDVPNTPDAYTHRIGRTGRSGLAGTALTFVTPADAKALRAIEQRLGQAIPLRNPGSHRPSADGAPAKATRSNGTGAKGTRANGKRSNARARRSRADRSGKPRPAGRLGEGTRGRAPAPKTTRAHGAPAKVAPEPVAFGQGV